MIEVIDAGVATTLQDRGRPGWARLGVPPSGALDRSSYEAANALVGNTDGQAALEITGGGVTLRCVDRHVLAVTGAACPGVPMDAAFTAEPGHEIRFEPPTHGFRTYLAVAGGFAARPVLGSRSRDQLSALGPAPVRRGDILDVDGPRTLDHGERPPASPMPRPCAAPDVVRIWPGPRDDWFADAIGHLVGHAWRIGDDIGRVGVRLVGSPLRRTRIGELPSEGMVTGAIQVPHDGQPIVLLADHPTTGGYPVVAIVDPQDVDRLAHLRPGDHLRFEAAPGAESGPRVV